MAERLSFLPISVELTLPIVGGELKERDYSLQPNIQITDGILIFAK